MNKHLQEIKSILDERFYCLFRDKNILEISLEKNDLPFMYLVVENPSFVLVSFSIELDNAALAAQLVLEINDILEAKIAEDFYISKDGEMYWEDEALEKMLIENNMQHPLMDMEPISSQKH